jgi:predicted hotdog family 3-hydroxylacyl-ACP dehydratase
VTLLKKEELKRLLPHGETMCLLESVEAWDALSITCRTSTHQDRHNPLRFKGRLTASSGLEYAAQAMGAHVGLVDGGRQTQNRIGLIGGVRDVVFAAERLDDLDGWLVVNATRLVEGEQGYLYHFAIMHQEKKLIEGRASLFVKAIG